MPGSAEEPADATVDRLANLAITSGVNLSASSLGEVPSIEVDAADYHSFWATISLATQAEVPADVSPEFSMASTNQAGFSTY